jgi:hypothetical protein
MRHPWSILSLVVVAASSCSADDGAIDAPDEFCERFAAAACSTEVIQACQAADADACRSSQVAFCLAELPSASFSGKMARQCLEAVEGAYSDADLDAAELGTVLRFGPPCDQLSSGPGGDGDACSDRRDCDAPAGYQCVWHGSEAPGVCRRPVLTGPGEDCSAEGAVCTAGFHCDGSHCIAGEAAGNPCVRHEECGPSRYCGLLSVCEARLPVRAPCGFDQQCASNLCYRLSASEQVCSDRVRLSLSEPICDGLR